MAKGDAKVGKVPEPGDSGAGNYTDAVYLSQNVQREFQKQAGERTVAANPSDAKWNAYVEASITSGEHAQKMARVASLVSPADPIDSGLPASYKEWQNYHTRSV
jgi:hypothetical protein